MNESTRAPLPLTRASMIRLGRLIAAYGRGADHATAIAQAMCWVAPALKRRGGDGLRLAGCFPGLDAGVLGQWFWAAYHECNGGGLFCAAPPVDDVTYRAFLVAARKRARVVIIPANGVIVPDRHEVEFDALERNASIMTEIIDRLSARSVDEFVMDFSPSFPADSLEFRGARLDDAVRTLADGTR
jgi:hypothetical protein